MSKLIELHGQYIDEVADQSSDRLGWRGLRMTLTREGSNDLMFTRMSKNALTLELTGTAAHLTHMDGIAAERRTQVDDICQMPTGVSARFAWDVGEREQRSIVVEFDEDLFSLYCPERFDGRMAHGHLTPRDYAPAPAIAGLMKLLSREIDPAQERGPIFADMLIRLLAIEICETAWTRRPQPAAAGQQHDRRMIRAIDYIHTHLASPISLKEIAAASGLSIGALAKLFPRQTGCSPHAYVVQKRVEKARQLLQSTAMPIAHVAIECGFADQSHMTKALTRHMAQTPRGLRLAAGRMARN